MNRRWLIVGVGLLATLLFVLLLPGGTVLSQNVSRVLIANWPNAQEVFGKVSIEGAVQVEPAGGWKINATLVRIEGIVVSPVKPTDTSSLVDAGVLETDGYPYVVLSLTGRVKGDISRPGSVGVILVPEEQTIKDAFDDFGKIIHPMRVQSEKIGVSAAYFDSDQPRLAVGFPSYRVFLYNTTDKSVEADLFAYLTTG